IENLAKTTEKNSTAIENLGSKFGKLEIITERNSLSIENLTKTVDDLAIIVKKGFDSVDQRFDTVDKKFNRVEGRLVNLEVGIEESNSRLRNVERDVSHIHNNGVFNTEFEDLSSRVKYIERKLSIQSGK
ncbi:MAG: hypothetical protein AAB682_01995, partial [Patescibacteria group bacterium]